MTALLLAKNRFMSINRIIFITVLGFLGSLLTLCSLFANAGVIIGLIGIVFLLAPLILFLCSSKSKRDWDDFKYPMIGSAILSLLLFLFLKSCVMTESPRRNYPYHNATTGRDNMSTAEAVSKKRI